MQSYGKHNRRAKRKPPVSVESLEGRALLSMGGNVSYPTPPSNPPPSNPPVTGPTLPPVPAPTNPTPAPTVPVTVSPTPTPTNPQGPIPATPRPAKPPTGRHNDARQHQPTGVVTKVPHFYSFYTGPKWAELNAVMASAKLSSNGNFTFTGTNQGRINKGPAVYVWGIDRNGSLPSGPFTGRPNITFDAVVIVSLDSSLKPTAQVMDLANGSTTVLPSTSVRIHGKTISVTFAENLLPSTGLAPSQYRFNYWPEDGGPPVSSSVASFAPELTTAQVGSAR